MISDEKLCDLLEAIQAMEFLKPLYLSVLKRTRSKKQACEAIAFVYKIMKDNNIDAHTASTLNGRGDA